MRRTRLLLAGLAALAAPLALAPSAFGLGFQNLSAAPADPDAGSHSDVNIHIGFTNATDQVKDLTVGLPPGLVGDPTGPVGPNGPCTVAELNADGCPDATEVGSVTAHVNIHLLDPLPLTLPLTVNGSIYNLVPQQGEPARFGIVLRPPLSDPPLPVLPKIIQQAAVQLRPDFGLSTVLTDTPHQSAGLETDITSLDMSLKGTANGQPFMRNPTSCGTQTTTFEANSYASPDETVTGQATYESVNCEALPFSPTLEATIGSTGHTAPGDLPPLTTVIEQAEGEAGMRRADVLLPANVGAANDPLVNDICPTASFEAGTCPANTIVGSAEADSPLLPPPPGGGAPLTGDVMIVAAAPNADPPLPRLGLDLQGPLHVPLLGNFLIAPTGNSFDGLPDIPLTRFRLDFDADHLLQTGRDLCEPPQPTFGINFTGHNGDVVTGDVPATVNGCGGSGNPKASIKLRRASSRKPKLAIDVNAGANPLAKLKVKIPKRYRFAFGNKFNNGVDLLVDGAASNDATFAHTARRVTAQDPDPAADSLALRVAKGALKQAGGKGKRFRVKVTDTEGDTFSFRLKP
jgi:hypothetical protein